MSRKILIVGAGISGLATLHYLKKKYAARPEVAISLLEQSPIPGGTIHSLVHGGCLFEAGPNGFLDSKPRTLDFVRELDLNGELIKADESAKIRYVALKDTLHAFPTGPLGFFAFKPFGWQDRARVFAEPFISRGNDPQESVYDFGARRFGKKFADIFLDPLVSGIYGGDARATVLKAAFGRIYELEQKHGSLFKAMMKLGKGGMPPAGSLPAKGTLTSFRRGQAQLTDALARRYAPDIRFDHEVKSITRVSGRFVAATAGARYEADEVFISAPAHQAAAMVRSMSSALAQSLDKIRYAPMAVIGLVFPRKAFTSPPTGFGYLVPSGEGKEVLGVLFESNIFPGRAPEDKVLMRVMIGGSRHPDILSKSREELTTLALKEVQATLKTDASPVETFFAQWPKAIPQYDAGYVASERALEEELPKWPGLHLVANYRHGVSLNDCIENAYQAAQGSF